ncbi:MAG: hypothetical protein ACR2NT_01505 [Acidimicrobiia bacterium]|nr:hypothetical protein [Acidimicrobiia bacterium]MDQ3499743.1 hypothetical protein [Actinomycetota bacterium]
MRPIGLRDLAGVVELEMGGHPDGGVVADLAMQLHVGPAFAPRRDRHPDFLDHFASLQRVGEEIDDELIDRDRPLATG